MKVRYETLLNKFAFDDPNRPMREVLSVEFCCKEMETAWDKDIIGFSD